MKYGQTRLVNMCTVMKCKVVLREYSFTVKDYEYLGGIASHSFPAAEDALQKACTSSFSLCINKFISWYLNSIEDWKCIYNFQQHIHLVSLTVLWEYQLRERSREVVISDSAVRAANSATTCSAEEVKVWASSASMQGPIKGRLQHRQLGKWKWWQERHVWWNATAQSCTCKRQEMLWEADCSELECDHNMHLNTDTFLLNLTWTAHCNCIVCGFHVDCTCMRSFE